MQQFNKNAKFFQNNTLSNIIRTFSNRMDNQEPELDKYGRKLPPKAGKYHVPRIAADAVLFHKGQILLIERGRDPFKG